MTSRTKFVFLMHPTEVKRIKNGTGRFAALSFADSEMFTGIHFTDHPRITSLLEDDQYYPVLLYPGPDAVNLSEGSLKAEDLGGKRLLVFLLDATWFLANHLYRYNPWIQELPQVKFTPSQKSRFVIKRQPEAYCLSTLEAVHELMLSLDASGLDHYEKPDQLITAFTAMQDFQIDCAERLHRPRFHGVKS